MDKSSIHGDTNFEVQTQEAQSFAFHASTGEGASEGGETGTGKAVLYIKVNPQLKSW